MLKLLLVLLVLVLAGLVYVRSSAPVAIVPQGSSQFAPPPTPASGEISVEVSEASMTEQLNQRLVGQSMGDTPLGKATLTSLTAQFKPNQLLANGDASVGGTSVPISVTGHVDMQGGKPLAVVSEVRAAGVALPDASRESIRKVVQDQVDQEVAKLQMKVTSITLTQGKMLIIGTHNS